MKWTVYFLALIRHCDKETTHEICRRIELAPRYIDIFIKERFEADRCLSWMERHLPLSNSTLYHQLTGFRIELALYMMAATKSEKVKKSISNYFTRLRNIQSSITGKDLIKMGLEPGPNFKKILQAVLDAKLNGRLKTRNDELGFVKDYVQ
jgi:tRNA nucleotidyltransferase (CCA-adding enzyme)